MGLVRVKLENGMEASLPEEHALASGYKPLDKPAVNTLGHALPATGAEEARAARKAKAAKKTAAKKSAAKKTTATPSGDAGQNA